VLNLEYKMALNKIIN